MLTKSDYLTFLDAPLHLWAKKNGQMEHKAPSPYSQHLMRQGYEVQKLAREFLKHKVDTQYPNAELRFEERLVDGEYECRIDALVHDKVYDTYDLYEIKSGSSIKKEYEYDVTFQCLIGRNQLNLHKIYLVLVNKDYVRNGEIDITQLFVVDDMMEAVAKREEEVLAGREAALQILQNTEPPTNEHCYKPKDCNCLELCHPNLSDYPIYDLYNGRKGKYGKLLKLGVTDLADIPEDFNLTDFQKLQYQSIKAQKPIINNVAIQKELEGLEYPLYFLDYECFAPAVPIYEGYKPYQYITFQYSIHKISSPDSDAEQFEYLTTDLIEPSKEFIKNLLDAIGSSGTVVVWNKNFECPRNREMAQLQPEFADKLIGINERTYDLLDPFRKGYYVDYRFHGSNSIKDVLPVLISNLNHKDLDVSDGTDAMMNWYEITFEENYTSTEKESIRQQLLEYCKLDTLAMVEIWKKIRSVVES